MTARKTLSGKPPQLNGWIAYLLSYRGVVRFWAVYCVAHAMLRLWISSTLTLDDSRASELVQEFALGYQARQPPLYEWLLWISQQAFGTGLASHLVVRYSLIFALGISCFTVARAALKDDRWAAAASLSLVISYPVGWAFHEWMTQTILLCIACFATLEAALNWFERPSSRAAFWLGVALGFGLLTKFSYPLFVAGLLVAALSFPEARRRLSDRRLLLSIVAAFVMISPYILWLYEVRGDVPTAINYAMVLVQKPYALRVLIGLAQLAKSIPLFLLPWLFFIALLSPAAFGFGKANSPAGFAERLTLRTMIATALLAVIGITLIGATNIAERYMHSILIVAPVYVFARVARFDPKEISLKPIAVFSVCAAIVVFGMRFLGSIDNGITKRADRLSQVPYEPLVAALRAQGIDRGTFVTFEVRDAGNLRAFMPQARVTSKDSFRILRPSAKPGSENCYLIYQPGHSKDVENFATSELSSPQRIDVIASQSRVGIPRRGTWWIARLDPKTPDCR